MPIPLFGPVSDNTILAWTAQLTVPTHMDITATLALRRRSSESAATTCRTPVQPNGCPKALWY